MRRRSIGIVAAAGFWIVGSAHGAAIEEVRILSATAEGVKAEILVPEPTVRPSPDHPGYNTIALGSLAQQGEPGEPSLPRVGFWVALPEGASATVSAVPMDEQQWDRIRPLPVPVEEWIGGEKEAPASSRMSFNESPSIYRGGGTWPEAIAKVGSESRLRYQRIVSIVVSPARWDAASGKLSVARKIEVTVTFRTGGARGKAAPGREVGRDDPSWERTYDGMILNAGQARGWGRTTAAPPARKSGVTAGPLAKIEVMTSGIKRVAYAEYADTLPASFQGASLADFRMFEVFNDTNDIRPDSTVEVPIYLIDADNSTTWTDGDEIYFYGQNLYDRRPDLPWYVKRYGRMHAYWLGLRPGGANARMEPIPSFIQADPLPIVDSYPWKAHFEKERFVYMPFGAEADDEHNLSAGVTAVKSKHVYWQGGQPFSASSDSLNIYNYYTEAFDLPGFKAGSTALGFAALFQGVAAPLEGGDHRLYLSFTTAGYRERRTLPRMPLVLALQDSGRYVANESDLAGMPIGESGNKFGHFQGASSYGAALEWFDVTYTREPRFVQPSTDMGKWIPVQISTGSTSGASEFVLSATRPITGQTMVGFETTDPRVPKVLTIDPAAQIQTRQMRVQWNLDGTDRRFAIGVAPSIARPEKIVESAGNDLLAPGDQDYVIVIPRDWIATIQPLIAQREAQGHRILVAPIEDIYDQFSGGRHWPHAIRSFLRALFRTRIPGPSFLLLVGDATDVFDSPTMDSDSGDLDHPNPSSAPNFVPTQTVFTDSFGDQGPDLNASDQWFVDNLAQIPDVPGSGTGEILNFLPDMHVGRLPVGDAAQLQGLVSKIIAYESFSPDDTWRNRGLLVSDDRWSTRTCYGLNGDESIFQGGSEEAIDLIANDGVQCDFETNPFFLACQMDTARTTPPGCSGAPNRCATLGTGCSCALFNQCDSEENNRCYGSAVIRGRLVSEMSRGHLFVSYIGHSNARLITHEYIFVDSPNARADIDLLGNQGKPFIFMGYGCHLNEFSGSAEAQLNQGDSMAENMILRYSDRGAVGSIASSAYEWISSSDQYEMAVFRSFFKDPPQFEGHTRWVLGEVVSGSKMDIVSGGFGSSNTLSQSETYCLLGDPGLVMDGAPPRIDVTLNGQPIRSGDPLTMPADSSRITIAGRVCDEVWARTLRIHDVHGEVSPDTLRTGDDRQFTFTYRTTIYPRNYVLELKADDGNGRVGTESFPVRVDAVFEIRRPGQDWVTLAEGELVVPEDSVRVRVTAPRYLAQSELAFLVNGAAEPVRAVPTDPINGTARTWTLSLMGSVPRGGTTGLGVKVVQPDNVDFVITRQVETEPTAKILDMYNIPNPFKAETAIFYRLGFQADEVAIRIYTTSGKLIRTLRDLPVRPSLGTPAAIWDGRDEDNDPVGNGLYFYKLIVKGRDDQGKPTTLSRIEKFARVQ